MYTATRPTIDAPWGPRIKMSSILGQTYFVIISPDDLELYFLSNRAGGMGGYDIWVSTRAIPDDPWGAPVNFDPTINTVSLDCLASISPDGLILFILSDHPGGFGGYDTWMARRSSKGTAWSAPVNLGPSFNTPNKDELSCVSADGRWAYIFNTAGGADDVWMAPIIPIVDFNGDGQADGKDLLCMTYYWDTNNPVCDIGPFAWGDGAVDLQDVIVLAEYFGKEVIDPTLIAHWTLDESEGRVTKDIISSDNAYVIGEPVWQPAGGQVAGALQLDGVDDCVVTSFVLDSSKGPFSIVAWAKGGAPGQVVVSHSLGMGDNCLMADAEGRLMTEFGSSNGANSALLSETVITDGKWHRIGFVWDGSYRHLYVDGAEVARDDTPLPSLESGEGGVYIGAGNGMEPGSLWSGLIDDIRIYSRVVSP